MALLPIHQFFSLNGEIKPNTDFIASENEGGIYEVLRVIDGIPVFLEEHLGRFYHSARLAGKTVRFNAQSIRNILKELIAVNQMKTGNVLISCKINLKAFFVPHVYPTADQYKSGVECGLLFAERMNPNAKVFQTQVRMLANKMMAEKGVYEVLLVDHEQRITEGSRSNVFFICGESIVTPSADKVLLGITRQKTISCAEELNYRVVERDVALNEIGDFDAIFVTGTSPKLLPVNKIADHQFSVHDEKLRKLMQLYDEKIRLYLEQEKKKSPF